MEVRPPEVVVDADPHEGHAAIRRALAEPPEVGGPGFGKVDVLELDPGDPGQLARAGDEAELVHLPAREGGVEGAADRGQPHGVSPFGSATPRSVRSTSSWRRALALQTRL